MSQIKVLKFMNGIPTEIQVSLDDIVAKSYIVGGPSGTALTKAILDTLSSGSSDASSLHNHDTQYWRKTEHISASSGGISANLPIETDSRGKLDPSFYQQSDITHGNLSGLSSDDHPQYFNQTRGDARYYPQTSFISSTSGVGDAGKPIKTNGSGKVDPTFLDVSASQHNSLAGLQGGQSSEYYHLTQTQHDTLTNGSDATALHEHDSRYYTKSQIDSSLAAKADDSVVIKKDGSVSFTADQSLGGNKITNLQDGVSASDATSKGQMDAADALKLSKAGDSMSGNLNMNGNKIVGLGLATVGTDAVNKNYVDNAVSGLSWRKPVTLIDVVHTILPATTATQIDSVTVVDQARVLFTNLNSNNNEVYKAAVSGGNIIWTLETDGQSGTGVPAEDDTLLVGEGTLYADSTWTFNGTLWVQTNGAGQIQAGVGLSKTGNTLDVNLGAGIVELPTDEVGLDLHVNGGLDLVDPTTALHSTANDAQLAIKLDGSTISKGASGIKVTDAGITEIQLAASVAGDGLTGGAGTPLAVNTGDGLQIVSDVVEVKASDIAGAGLEDDGSNNLRIAASVAGAALALTSGVLDVQTDNSTIEVNADALRVKDAGITTAKLASQAADNTKILFGTSGNGVRASNIPLVDTVNHFVTDNVEAALAELADAAYIEVFTAGETIGQTDAVVLRRDSSNNLRAYRASAAGSDNYVAGTLVIADLTFTAVTPSGNNISVAYINPAVINSALSVSVTGTAISVSLATDGSAAITSTASQINTAVNSHLGASALVSSAVTGTGSNIQSAHSAAFLTGGMDFNDNGRWCVEGVALDAAPSPGNTFRVQKFGALTANFVSAPTSVQIGQDVYLSINQGKLSVNVSPTSTNDAIIYVGRLRSTTQVEFKSSVLRGVNG